MFELMKFKDVAVGQKFWTDYWEYHKVDDFTDILGSWNTNNTEDARGCWFYDGCVVRVIPT